MKVHPLCAVFPDLTEKEYADLKDSIENYGQRVPIAVDCDGQIVDGRHRWRICEELGLTPKTVKLGRADDIGEYVTIHNLRRRSLTQAQRDKAIMEIDRIERAATAERVRIAEISEKVGVRTRAHPPHRKGSAARTAKKTGRSERYVQQLREVSEKAPEKLAEVEAGTKSVLAAVAEIKATERAKPDAVDPNGVEIPKELLAVFAAKKLLGEFERRARAFADDVEGSLENPGFAAIGDRAKEIVGQLRKACTTFRFYLPYCVWPKNGPKNHPLQKRGWLVKSEFDRIEA